MIFLIIVKSLDVRHPINNGKNIVTVFWRGIILINDYVVARFYSATLHFFGIIHGITHGLNNKKAFFALPADFFTWHCKISFQILLGKNSCRAAVSRPENREF